MAGLVESRSKRGCPQWVESRRLRELANRDDQWLAQVSRVDVDGLLPVVGPNTELVEAREEIRVIESPPIEHDLGLGKAEPCLATICRQVGCCQQSTERVGVGILFVDELPPIVDGAVEACVGQSLLQRDVRRSRARLGEVPSAGMHVEKEQAI